MTTMGTHDFLRSVDLQMQTLDVWIEQEWLLPQATPAGPSFSDRDVARARFIGDLRGTLGVNDEGIGVILHLVDQLHGLRSALAELRETLPRGQSQRPPS